MLATLIKTTTEEKLPRWMEEEKEEEARIKAKNVIKQIYVS
jgi:hypothetical protein